MSPAEYIKDCQLQYESSFANNDWIEKLDWQNRADKAYIDGCVKIDNYTNFAFQYISKSLLAGEYAYRADVFPTLVSNLTSILVSEMPPNDCDSDSVEIKKYKTNLYIKIESLNHELKQTFKKYLQLYNVVKSSIDITSHNLLFDALTKSEYDQKKYLLKHISQYFIPVFRYEHTISFYTDRTLTKNLILIQNVLTKEVEKCSEHKSIYQAVLDKCNFILWKILDRKSTEYIIENQWHIVRRENISIPSLQKYVERFDFMTNQPNIREDKVMQWQLNTQKARVKIDEFILLARYYTKIRGTEQQIENLIKNFDTVYEKSINSAREFSSYALKTTKSYIYNCRFSYKLKQRKYSIDSMEADINIIRSLQIETNSFSYYPYLKAVQYLLLSIKKDIDNGNREALDTKISLIEEYLPTLESNIEWCKEKLPYPFQVPYNNCCTTYETEIKNPLFIPSSFAKPINYNEVDQKYRDITTDFANIKISRERLEATNQLEKIKEDIRNSEKRYIELLGIFTAVIAFIFSCITIFSAPTEQPFTDRLKGVIAIGTLLLLFTSTIYFLTLPGKLRYTKYVCHPRFWFFAVSFITYIIVTFRLLYNI